MLRITCPNCQSKLNAKEKLIGQKRKCPKCGSEVLIAPPDDEANEAATPPQETASESDAEMPSIIVSPQETEPLAQVVAVADPPRELTSPNRYVICDRQRVIAVWEGNGWQLKTASGLVPAKRFTEDIPGQGIFRLIELRITSSGDALHLTGIVCHELTPRWALPAIGRGDNPILEKIVGPAGMTREQKQTLRRYLQDSFMPEVWRDRTEITDFLASPDAHTQGVA